MIGDEQSLRAFIREELDRSQMGVMVRQLQGRSVTGVSGATWGGGAASSVATVSHRLGVKPKGVVATFDAVGSGQSAYAVVGNLGATSFDLVGVSPVAFSGTLAFYWVAFV